MFARDYRLCESEINFVVRTKWRIRWDREQKLVPTDLPKLVLLDLYLEIIRSKKSHRKR